MFPCEQCGCCCRMVSKVSFARYLALDDGTCKYLDKETNLCKIYDERPDFCRVDEFYENVVSKYMALEKFYELNKKACKKFQAEIRGYTMDEKIWITYKTEVNGLPQELRFSKGAVEKIFKPFLIKLSELREMTDRKVVAFIAAPPGTGKSSVAQFLEHFSREHMEFTPIRALGMDGFHYPSEYLKANSIVKDDQEILLNDIKGAPETFDVDTLQEKLREVRQEGTDWNIYDRMIHDVVHDVLSVDDDIILLEGNYLLLKEPRWTNIRVLADYTVFIKARPELLKERLIARKIQGGLSPEEAEKFYYASDGKNVERVLNNSAPANETWMLQPDDDYFKIEDDEDVVLDNIDLNMEGEIPFEDIR